MKKKLIIFDLDGVLINSKYNMEVSWNSLNTKYNLGINFKKYFKFIGIPFEEILKKLNINENYSIYKKHYDFLSKKNIKLIKLYPGVKKTLKMLKKKKIKIAIVTSKDFNRTKKILKIKLNSINFDLVNSPVKKFRSKPHPDLILNTISRLNVDPSESLYCGDMTYDLQTAKRAEIMFVLAKYGYSSNLKTNHKIKKFSNILKYI